jgi:Ser/Thr protein kinase RdoA (MazF antagonist)
VSPEEVWDNLPEEAREPVRRAADAAARAMDALGTGNDAYGLIHADLHFGNVLFAGDEILPIDFDDCGYALLIYDIAVPLADYLDEPEWETRRDSLLDGYRSIRPYPAGMEQLPAIMAARHATLLLWAVDRARTNEQFRKYLPTWTEWNCGSIEKAFAL